MKHGFAFLLTLCLSISLLGRALAQTNPSQNIVAPTVVKMTSFHGTPAGDIVLPVGDTAPRLDAVLLDATGRMVDLTGATVTVTAMPPAGGANLFSAPCAVVNPPGGTVEYAWQATDTQSPGTYALRFNAVFPDGTTIAFPSDHNLKLVIQANTAFVTSGTSPPPPGSMTTAQNIATLAPYFLPENYGVAGNGKTDDTAALNAFFQIAKTGTAFLSGHYVTSGTVTDPGASIIATRNAWLRCYPASAAFTGPALSISSTDGNTVTVTGLSVSGKASTALGVSDYLQTGFQVTQGPVYFRDCNTSRLYAGWDIESTSGHVYWENCGVGGYYGAWFGVNNGDYHMIDCRCAGSFAAIGYAAPGLTIQCDKCAIGFGPFGIYQVNTNSVSAGGLVHCQFYDCSFEALGNEAIYSEYARTKTIPVIVNTTDFTMLYSGFSYLSLFNLPAYPSQYDIEVDAPEGEFTLDNSLNPLEKGIYMNRPRANNNLISLKWRGASASSVTVGTGQTAPVMSIVGAL